VNSIVTVDGSNIAKSDCSRHCHEDRSQTAPLAMRDRNKPLSTGHHRLSVSGINEPQYGSTAGRWTARRDDRRDAASRRGTNAGGSRSWRTQKGRGRLSRPPTPQAPQARGAQRRPRERSERGPARLRLARSRDTERPRAFECRPLPDQTSNQSAVSSDQVLNESKPIHERHRVPVALAREHGFGPLPSRDIGRIDVDFSCSPGTEMLGS